MNWFPQVSSGYFALAGLICALGPVLIHLLNRRRFRVVPWAAMEFLFDAQVERKRKFRLRDILLLVFRTLAVLFFGLALARPYLGSQDSVVDANSPRHLIVILDNSLSMGYQRLDTSLLEQAKQQAGSLIDSLPDGSQVTIVEACGRGNGTNGPFRRKSDALERLATIQLMDSVSRIEDIIAAARSAAGAAAPLVDQIVYFTDLQRINWPGSIDSGWFESLPLIHIRNMSGDTRDNSWVTDVRLRDDIVDLDAPATVFVTVRHRGVSPRRTQVSLAVNMTMVATRSVELLPGQSKRMEFECSFADAPVEPGDATFVAVQASLAPDRLPQDDRKTIMVPVVTSLPAVFVDQYRDEQEDPALGMLGETRPLRHLLAPKTSDRNRRPLIAIRHVTIDEVDQALLAASRLVVVAGVADPGPAIELLRQYVQQGGPLVVAAGGQFNPTQWNLAAGPNAAGLLPGNFAIEPLGTVPDEAVNGTLTPFKLSLASLASDPLLRLPGLADEQLREIYREPLFFKSLVMELDPTDDPDPDTSEVTSPSDRWLAWTSPQQPIDSSQLATSERAANTEHTRVCARYDDAQATPFVVRHRVGKGQVLCTTTSIMPSWNNLAQTNAIVLWDHVLRSLIRSTLPQRNFLAQEQLSIPIPDGEYYSRVRLQRPDDRAATETVDVGFIQKNQQGVTIPNAWARGLYRLVSADSPDDDGPAPMRLWQTQLAVDGVDRESDLTVLSGDEIRAQIIDGGFGRLFQGDSLLTVSQVTQGSMIWWWLVLAAFALLVTELVLLALTNS